MNDLERFIRAYPAHCEVRDDWAVDPPAAMLARLALTDELPPADFVSSVLAIVLDGTGQVLFLYPETPTGSIAHVLIGGRQEAHETLAETVIREVAEETGWIVRPAALIGYRHFHQLGSRHAALVDRPYPDFVQPVLAARAQRYDENLLHAGEAPARFVPTGWALAKTHAPQRPLLDAAIESGE